MTKMQEQAQELREKLARETRQREAVLWEKMFPY